MYIVVGLGGVEPNADGSNWDRSKKILGAESLWNTRSDIASVPPLGVFNPLGEM